MTEMAEQYYVVSISTRRFVPIGQQNVGGYSTYTAAYGAMQEYAEYATLQPPYAIIKVLQTFKNEPVEEPQFELRVSPTDPWQALI